MALRISRYAQVRGRPRPLMGSASRAAKRLHCLSFKSVGYSRRGWVSIPQGYRLHLQNALLGSLGMVLARSCALSAVSLFLAHGRERKPNPVRQQLREFCYEAKVKRGGPRHELAVETCFAPLLAWVLRW